MRVGISFSNSRRRRGEHRGLFNFVASQFVTASRGECVSQFVDALVESIAPGLIDAGGSQTMMASRCSEEMSVRTPLRSVLIARNRRPRLQSLSRRPARDPGRSCRGGR